MYTVFILNLNFKTHYPIILIVIAGVLFAQFVLSSITNHILMGKTSKEVERWETEDFSVEERTKLFLAIHKPFKVGDIIQIDKMLFDGKYIVTSVRESFFNNVIEYIVTCKNANIINNYIDLFRSNLTEEDENKTFEINVSHYSSEGIKETFEVIQ